MTEAGDAWNVAAVAVTVTATVTVTVTVAVTVAVAVTVQARMSLYTIQCSIVASTDAACVIAAVIGIVYVSQAGVVWQVSDFPSFRQRSSLPAHMERVVSCKFDPSGRHVTTPLLAPVPCNCTLLVVCCTDNLRAYNRDIRSCCYYMQLHAALLVYNAFG